MKSSVEVLTIEVARLSKECLQGIKDWRAREIQRLKSKAEREKLASKNFWRCVTFRKPLEKLPYEVRPDLLEVSLTKHTYGLTEDIAERLLRVATFTDEIKMVVAVEELDRLLEWKK